MAKRTVSKLVLRRPSSAISLSRFGPKRCYSRSNVTRSTGNEHQRSRLDGGHNCSCFVTYTINLLEGLYGMYMANVGKREFNCSRQIVYDGRLWWRCGGSAPRDELWVGESFPTAAQRPPTERRAALGSGCEQPAPPGCVFLAAILAHE